MIIPSILNCTSRGVNAKVFHSTAWIDLRISKLSHKALLMHY